MSWFIYFIGYAHLVIAPILWIYGGGPMTGLTAAIIWGFGVVFIGISAIIDAIKERQP